MCFSSGRRLAMPCWKWAPKGTRAAIKSRLQGRHCAFYRALLQGRTHLERQARLNHQPSRDSARDREHLAAPRQNTHRSGQGANESGTTMHLSGAEVFASSHNTDMYAAIDSMIDKLDRQVIKHKEKLKKH